jgi:two-component system sensor histidine kinase UhpB
VIGLLAKLHNRVPSSRNGTWSIRAYLSAIVASILTPALLIGGWLASQSAEAARAQLELNLEQKTREIAVDVNREIATAGSILTALASSHFLEIGDFEAFYRQASDVSQQLKMQIVLRDPILDEQIINTAAPWGAPRRRDAPPEIREGDRQPLGAKKFITTNVFFGRLNNDYIIAVRMPIVRNGILAYFIGATIPANRFAEILRDSDLRSDYVASIIDRNNTIVARSEQHAEFVGKQTQNDVNGRAPDPKGRWDGRSIAGAPFHWVYSRSEATGWLILTGVPQSVLNGPSQIALASYAAAGSLLLAIAIGFAYGWGGRFSHAFGALGIDRKPTREEFQVLFEHAPNGVAVVESGGHIALLNAQMETMFGFSRDELVGEPIEILIPERLHGRHLKFRTAFAHAPDARPMGAGRDLFGRRKDGTEFPIEIGLKPIRTTGGWLVMATVVDITKRQLAAKQLSGALAERDDLRRRFMQAQEDERLRLAHELHDQTGQSLTAILMELKDIESLADAGERDRLRSLRLQLDQMGKALHHVAWELRPASIDELGLASALANYVSEWNEQYAIEADFYCVDSKLDDLSNEIRTTIYRIVQEALTNVAKHTPAATSVSVVIDRVEATVQLTIDDNGCGFDKTPNELVNGRGGLGLAGMRERISLVGGAFEIESSPGVGTTIFARIPVQSEKAAA